MLQRKAGPIQLCPEFSKCDELSLEKELSDHTVHNLGSQFSLFLIIFKRVVKPCILSQEYFFQGKDLKAQEGLQRTLI